LGILASAVISNGATLWVEAASSTGEGPGDMEDGSDTHTRRRQSDGSDGKDHGGSRGTTGEYGGQYPHSGDNDRGEDHERREGDEGDPGGGGGQEGRPVRTKQRKAKRSRSPSPELTRSLRPRTRDVEGVQEPSDLVVYSVGSDFRSSISLELESMVASFHANPDVRAFCCQIQHSAQQYLRAEFSPQFGWSRTALIDIPQGTKVCYYTGTLLPATSRRRSNHRYELGVLFNTRVIIDGAHHSGTQTGLECMQMVNHACEPNCIAKQEDFPEGLAVCYLTTAKRIQQGEHITFNYKGDFWQNGTQVPRPGYSIITCRCGAPSCRRPWRLERKKHGRSQTKATGAGSEESRMRGRAYRSPAPGLPPNTVDDEEVSERKFIPPSDRLAAEQRLVTTGNFPDAALTALADGRGGPGGLCEPCHTIDPRGAKHFEQTSIAAWLQCTRPTGPTTPNSGERGNGRSHIGSSCGPSRFWITSRRCDCQRQYRIIRGQWPAASSRTCIAPQSGCPLIGDALGLPRCQRAST